MGSTLEALQAGDNPAVPKAHLNYLFFNDKMELVQGASGSVQVPYGLQGWGTITPAPNNVIGTSTQVAAPEPGYVIVYIDNQTIGKKVWFDHLMVGHHKGKVIEQDHYYPFGLTLQTDVDQNVTGQPFKYNGKELEKSFGLETYDFGARFYNSQIARWNGVDELADKFSWQSPYVAMDNNPVLKNDPTGKSGEVVINKNNSTVTVTSNIIFYGKDGSKELATKAANNIQSQWNGANGKTTIDGVEYSVKFVVTGSYDNSITSDDINNNTDIKNNYIKLVASGIPISYMDAAGSNTGEFLISNINEPNSTTESHEFGHGYGLDHPSNTDLRTPLGWIIPAKAPGIMYPRGTAVDKEYTYKPSEGATWDNILTGKRENTMNPTTRKVTQTDIDNLKLNKIKYDPSTGNGQLGRLTNIIH